MRNVLSEPDVVSLDIDERRNRIGNATQFVMSSWANITRPATELGPRTLF